MHVSCISCMLWIRLFTLCGNKTSHAFRCIQQWCAYTYIRKHVYRHETEQLHRRRRRRRWQQQNGKPPKRYTIQRPNIISTTEICIYIMYIYFFLPRICGIYIVLYIYMRCCSNVDYYEIVLVCDAFSILGIDCRLICVRMVPKSNFVNWQIHFFFCLLGQYCYFFVPSFCLSDSLCSVIWHACTYTHRTTRKKNTKVFKDQFW